jgi:hypothetical protein
MGSSGPSAYTVATIPPWAKALTRPTPPPPEPTSPIAALKARIARIKRASTVSDARAEADMEAIRDMLGNDDAPPVS